MTLKVIQRDPAQDVHVVGAVEELVRSGDVPRAVDMARAALDTGVIHPMLLNLRSYWHTQHGRTAEALSDLQTAMAIAPSDVFVRNALAVLLGKLGQWGQAAAILQETVKIAPGFAPAQFSLGWVREFTGELTDARRHFETAVKLDPNFAAPLAHLASLAYRRADWQTSQDLVTRALAIDPNNVVALVTLAASAVAQGDLARGEAILKRVPDFSKLPQTETQLAESTLGDLRDAQGRYSEAFAAFTRRNQSKFQQAAPLFDIPGQTATDYVRWLARYFGALPPGAWSMQLEPVPDDPRDGARGHVFLVGFPRSGTTLLENVLASHPDVCALDERDTLGEAARAFFGDDVARDDLARITPAEIERHRALYWSKVRELGVNVKGKVFVDKYPLTTIKLPIVAKLFPKARILFALRDPRDVLLSCYRRFFSINSSMFELLDLERGARFYDAVMTLGAIYRKSLRLAWHDIRYEALVSDFEGETRRLCSFMDLEWNERVRDFAELSRQRTIKTPSSIQVVRGLYKEGRGQWHNYENELAPVIPILQPWIEEFGYAGA